MRFVKASERLPEIWYASGKASKRLHLKVQGHLAMGRLIESEEVKTFEVVTYNSLTIFEKESFHLIEWLDEADETRSPDESFIDELKTMCPDNGPDWQTAWKFCCDKAKELLTNKKKEEDI